MRVFISLSVLAVPVLMSSFYGSAFAQDPTAAPRNSHRLIITDVDDTVKVTDVSHALDSLVRATFGRKAFAGISTLYQEMGSHDSSDLFEHSTLYFVSGGPEIFRKSVVEWSAGMMFVYSKARDLLDGNYHSEFTSSWTLSHEIPGVVKHCEGYVEIYSNSSNEVGSAWIATFDFGLVYSLTETIKLDAGANIGLTPPAIDYDPFVGLSLRI